MQRAAPPGARGTPGDAWVPKPPVPHGHPVVARARRRAAQPAAVPRDRLADEPRADARAKPGSALVRAVLPVATLFVGKLIIDEVVRLSQTLDPSTPVRDGSTRGSLDTLDPAGSPSSSGSRSLSDVLGRVVSLLDSLLSEQFTNATSIRLMQHAATLDLEDFEDSELQDSLDRARRQTIGPHRRS